MIKLTVESPELLKEIKSYLKENESLQKRGYSKNIGVESIEGNVIWSNLDAFNFIEKMGNFGQLVTSSIQCGNLYLVNPDGKSNKDASLCGGGLTGSSVKRVWFNATIQEFDSIESGKEQSAFSDLVG